MSFSTTVKAVFKANTSGYEQGQKRMARATEKMEKRVKSASSRAARAFGRMRNVVSFALAAVAKAMSALAFTRKTREMIAFADELGKMSRNLGLTAENFQELKITANEAGVSQKIFMKAMSRWTAALGKAAAGDMEYLATFQEAGVALRDRAGQMRTNKDILLDYLDVIGKANDANAAYFASEGFGTKAGIKIVELARLQRDGIEERMKLHQQEGRIINQDVLKQYEEIENEIGLIEDKTQKDWALALRALAPLTLDIENMMGSIVGHTRNFVESINTGLSGQEMRSLVTMKEHLAEINDELERRQRTSESGFLEHMLRFGSGKRSLIKGGGDDILTRKAGLERSIAVEHGKAALRARLQTGGDLYAAPATPKAPGSAAASTEAPIRKNHAAIRESIKLNKMLAEGQRMLADYTKQQKEEAEEFAQLEMDEALNRVNLQQDLIEQQVEMSTEYVSTQERMKQATEDMAMSVMMGYEDIGDAFKGLITEMIAQAMRTAVIQPMINGLFGAVGGFLGFGAGSAATPGVFSPGPVSLGPLGARAGGGSVSKGNPYLVGESGRELFVPGASGTVIPHSKTEGMMGGSGVTINQTLNFSLGVQQTVRSEVQNMMPQIADSAKQAVIDARERGGSMASAFG